MTRRRNLTCEVCGASVSDDSTGGNAMRRHCRLFHRWGSIENARWIGGIAVPVFLFTCRRCGAERFRSFGP